jgi:hypothetical protein
MTINNQDKSDNLLVALRKWASRQEENFYTEAFAHLLRDWLRKRPKSAMEVLNTILGPDFVTETDCNSLRVIPQKRVDDRQPDIRIKISNELRAIVEVKVRQNPDWEQLKEYRKELDQEQSSSPKRLALLTRDQIEPTDATELDSKLVYLPARWHKVAESIREELGKMEEKDGISAYLGKQFLEFLAAGRMTMKRVDKDLVSGVPAFASLVEMLDSAVDTCFQGNPHWKCPKPFYWKEDSTGWYFGPNGEDYWSGVFHDDGGKLFFEAYGLDRMAMENVAGWFLGVEGDDKQDVWKYRLDLESNGFFDLRLEQQKSRINDFIRDRLDEVNSRVTGFKSGASG